MNLITSSPSHGVLLVLLLRVISYHTYVQHTVLYQLPTVRKPLGQGKVKRLCHFAVTFLDHRHDLFFTLVHCFCCGWWLVVVLRPVAPPLLLLVAQWWSAGGTPITVRTVSAEEYCTVYTRMCGMFYFILFYFILTLI